jgi:hypothetical protein
VSSIASFYRLNRVDLPGFVEAAGTEPKTRFDAPAYTYLDQHAYDLPDVNEEFDFSGYMLLQLLTFLEESGTDLGGDEYRREAEAINATFDYTVLITSADQRHLPALALEEIDLDAAADHFADMGFDDAEQMREAVDYCLQVLHEQITALTDEHILIVHIG